MGKSLFWRATSFVSWGIGIFVRIYSIFLDFKAIFGSWWTPRFSYLYNSVDYCSVLWKLMFEVMCLCGADGEVNIFKSEALCELRWD